ncbi:TonB-dependent receptor [Flavobacterium sp. XS2P12]|uniref:TonB-dependent receptor n=1 Tax=Flavobacterium melibiosi TaxID=3398734 RepID=UPI003A84C99D
MQFFKRLTVFISCVFFSANLFAQEGKIQGKVSDSNGLTLPGSSIKIEGSNKNTVTDSNGDFVLENVANGSYTITISYIGFSSKKLSVKVPQLGKLSVTLQEDQSLLDEVVVTGAFDARKQINSSVSISTLDAKQLERLQPNSAADLLKNIPGVFVNSSAGEVRNTITSRGISNRPSFNFDVPGSNYVSMQEDGLPVSNILFSYFAPDLFLRNDVTTKRLEAVRGGSAAIVGANAPAGVFNYISKTGGNTFGGEIRTKYGLEGNGSNPYYRADINFGGPMGKSGWTYNVGGFYRTSTGPVDPGYQSNRGGQVKLNIEKKYKTGSITFYGKYLNDHNLTAMNLIGKNFDNPQLADGVKSTDFYGLPATAVQSFQIDGKTITHDPKRLNHSKDLSFGANWKQKLGNDWSLQNNARFSAKSLVLNQTAALNPVTLTGFINNAVAGTIGRGTITYQNNNTKEVLATVQASLSPGPTWTVLTNTMPGQNILKDGMLYAAAVYSDPKVNEFLDQLVITKRIKNMTFNIGSFVGISNVGRYSNGVAGIGFATLENRPQMLDISYANVFLGGATQQITSPEGFAKTGGVFGFNDFEFHKTNLAPFFAHNWEITNKLTLDWGVRLDNTKSEGTNYIRTANNGADGGFDSNSLTTYDNGYFKNPTAINYSFITNTVSFSGALNYLLSDKQSVYLRYSNGKKAPEFDLYATIDIPGKVALTNPVVQGVTQVELGYKIKTNNVNLTLTPFYSRLNNVLQAFTALDNNGQIYNLTPYFNSLETMGVETEVTVKLSDNFNVRAVGTFQSANFEQFKIATAGPTSSRDDDSFLDFSGNNVDNTPSVQFNVTPTYSRDKFYTFISWQYLGSRWANAPNAFKLSAFSQFDLGMGYDLSKKLSLSLNVNNLANTFGVMNWGAPGGFPAAFNLSEFSEAKKIAQKDALFPVGGTQPRSYFLTATYKF